MAFGDFTFPEVQHDLGLNLNEADLFSQVPALSPREVFAATIAEGAMVALAINTEKAKSEFIVAPILLELRHLLGGAIGLFSGVELDVDSARGLNGICDFILTKGPSQFVLSAPLVTIVEAKNDNLRNGLGQCIAAMFAAVEMYNLKISQADARCVRGRHNRKPLLKFLGPDGGDTDSGSQGILHRQRG